MEARTISIPGEPSQVKKFANNMVISSRYTILTFIPKNLYEQFRRVVNFFYLCLIVIQLTLDVPVNPIPYIAAFSFVLVLTAIKRGYEDYEVHQADKKINDKIVRVVGENGNIIEMKSCKLQVGQIVKLTEDEPVPCDLILLACLSTNGNNIHQCQITTANLDGEANHKLRICPSILPELGKTDNILHGLKNEMIKLEYSLPNDDLYNFSGSLTSGKSKQFVDLTMDNILLRGTTLKSSGEVYGCIIYTGKETRLSKNSDVTKAAKFSTVEHTMNKIVALMFGLLLVMSGISVGLFFMYRDTTKIVEAWYIPPEHNGDAMAAVLTFFSYLTLFCYLIPVSLPVTFELQKFGCSKFFAWDEDISCQRTGTPAICNTSDLNEELGQIEYLFTDKTGTLTENNLKLLFCSIDGVRYEYSEGKLTEAISTEVQKGKVKPESNEKVQAFLRALALCHTVQIIPSSDMKSNEEEFENIRYYASSLDEETLVKAANSLGMKYVSQTNDLITIKFGSKVEVFRRHLILQFDADRKCMSVIVEDSEKRIWVISKGAESTLLPKVSNDETSNAELVLTHINQFAELGLRTLVIVQKEITREELDEILSRTEQLRRDPVGLKNLYSEIESNFVILGATGVEDQLQDGVPETLQKLKEAGIRIWMLTGDKLETAVNIGISCGLESSKKNMTMIANCTDKASISEALEKIKNDKRSLTLVIDGISFATGLEYCKERLTEIMTAANQVIFCRMTPLQKAQVVQVIKSSKSRIGVTCAVGDGGNDVAMIKEAHIGIGIMGKEGRQAARSSDFAIARFKFLQKVILVHGYWYYYRLANLILYFFYRGVYFVFPIFLYGFECVYSANTPYDSIFVMLFALTHTSLPILIYGLTDQPIPDKELLKNPIYYLSLRGNSYFHWGNVFKWIFVTIWHIIVCYFGVWAFWDHFNMQNDWGTFSILINCILVAVSDLKILVESRYFTWPVLIGQILSFASIVLFNIVLFEIGSGSGGSLDFAYFKLMSEPQSFLAILLLIFASLLPDYCLGPALSLVQGKGRLGATFPDIPKTKKR